MQRKGILIVVSGFSGAGKGTLMKRMVERFDNYALSVSMTTRKPRPGEKEGVSYFFVEKDEFERCIGQDGLVEYASYCGNYYGTPRAWVQEQLEAGRDVILEIEIQGALKVKEKFPDALLLFVMTPSAQELKRRLEGRGTESQDDIRGRLQRAVEESRGIEAYDYIIVNDDLEECIAQMNRTIEAARMRPDRKKEFVDQFRLELEEILKGEN
ncbi:MAG TPA: guanylate kinase [Candidatus Eisenbergiella merdigallinarum]|uniref:Guanylate kinase n=1 Tax=Candidatus Eisenbergiella merdigallinarum TaxID=2838552 RepID=A0A9D2SDH1_9FIRM|nr:guanylate kinase [Candidatus Eisenbergiella merdigallinarum]